MKMWKKAASVMLASAMVVSLAACGSSGNKSGGSSDSDTFKIGGIGPTTQQAESTENRLNISLKMTRQIQRNL